MREQLQKKWGRVTHNVAKGGNAYKKRGWSNIQRI